MASITIFFRTLFSSIGVYSVHNSTFEVMLAAGLGVEGPVTSPTFTLVREYPLADGLGHPARLLHADVYRLESLDDVADLGLAELVEEDAVLLVEWGDVAAPALGRSTLTVALTRPEAADDETFVTGDEARLMALEGRGPDWAGRRGEVADAVAAAAGGRA